MSKGRKQTARSQHELRGRPSKRPLPRNAPLILPSGVPEPPESVRANATALSEWIRITQILLQRGAITELDRDGISNWCLLHAIRERAALDVARHGPTIRVPVMDRRNRKVGSVTRKNPAFAVLNTVINTMRQLSLYGFDPKSRQGLLPFTEPAPKEDKFEKHLREAQALQQDALINNVN